MSRMSFYFLFDNTQSSNGYIYRNIFLYNKVCISFEFSFCYSFLSFMTFECCHIKMDKLKVNNTLTMIQNYLNFWPFNRSTVEYSFSTVINIIYHHFMQYNVRCFSGLSAEVIGLNKLQLHFLYLFTHSF